MAAWAWAAWAHSSALEPPARRRQKRRLLRVRPARLRQTGLFDDMTRKTDEDEHSLEMHLPYLLSVMQVQLY